MKIKKSPSRGRGRGRGRQEEEKKKKKKKQARRAKASKLQEENAGRRGDWGEGPRWYRLVMTRTPQTRNSRRVLGRAGQGESVMYGK